MRTNLQISLSFLLLAMVFSACQNQVMRSVVLGTQPTRYVSEGDYLLKSNPGLKADKRLPGGQLSDAIRLESNRKIGFVRVYLGLYNVGQSMKEDTALLIRPFLRRNRLTTSYTKVSDALTKGIGEVPAVLDMENIRDDSASLRNVCLANGFFHPEISYRIDTVRPWFRKRDIQMVNVTYNVQGGTRYLIRDVSVLVGDSLASDSVLSVINWAQSGLKPTDPYNQQALILERARITDYMRNRGFFTFSPTLISFFVDTLTSADGLSAGALAEDRLIDIQVILDDLPGQFIVSEIELSIKQDDYQFNPLYRASVNLRPGQIPRREYERLGLSPKVMHDSLEMTFVVDEELIPRMNFNFLASRIHVKEGEPYSQQEARLTLQRLQELGMLRIATIKYELKEEKQELRVLLEVQMAPHYQVKAGFESFYDRNYSAVSNLPSVGGNISLRNRNAFHQSELIELGLSGAVGFYSANVEDPSIPQALYYGLGSQINMNIPGLLAPIVRKRDLSNLSPVTLSSMEVKVDRREEFNRVQAGGRISYRWNHEPFSTQSVSELTPFFFEVINTDTDSAFQADFVDKLPPSIRQDFGRRISTRIQYAFTYQDYRSTRARPTSWSRFTIELGGNLPFLLDSLDFVRAWVNDTSNSDKLVANRLFHGQYVKASAEVKYLIPFRNDADLVFRVFLGGAVPYSGTSVVPRESRFFSGGPNSMRGWPSNTLGPGTLELQDLVDQNDNFGDTTNLGLIAPGGEWIFEANAEYRFKLLPPYFELGLFTDIGNVWFHNSSEIIEQINEGEKAVISPENLRLGWDAGIGFRFDFDLVILRFDVGQRIFAPATGWVRRLSPVPSIGVDYPF